MWPETPGPCALRGVEEAARECLRCSARGLVAISSVVRFEVKGRNDRVWGVECNVGAVTKLHRVA